MNRGAMARRSEVNKRLLTREEQREYERRTVQVGKTLLDERRRRLPDDTQRRIQGARRLHDRRQHVVFWWSVGIGIAAVIAAGVAGWFVDGVPAAVPFAMGAGFMVYCVAGVVHTILGGAADRAEQTVWDEYRNEYLNEIGYYARQDKGKRVDSGADGDDGSFNMRKYPVTDGYYNPELYRERGGWDPTWADPVVQDMYGGDYDTYESNRPD